MAAVGGGEGNGAAVGPRPCPPARPAAPDRRTAGKRSGSSFSGGGNGEPPVTQGGRESHALHHAPAKPPPDTVDR